MKTKAKALAARGGTKGHQSDARTASEGRVGPIFRVDRMRVWNHKPGDFTAHTELRAREGEMFLVQVIGLEAHPMPKLNREKRFPVELSATSPPVGKP